MSTEEIGGILTRRNLFLMGGLGAVAVGMTGTAAAAPATETDNANAKLIEDFCNSWNDPDKSVSYLAPDAVVRLSEDQPPVTGPAAAAAAFKSFMGHGEKISVKIFTTFSKHPLVANVRTDTLIVPGKADQVFQVVGVFIVKNGKIKEWTDYLRT